MRFHVITYLVTHPGRQRELTAVFQLRVQLAFQAQQHMPAFAPVIGQVAGGVLHHAYTSVSEMAGAPQRMAGNAGVNDGVDGGPVGGAKGDSGEVHGGLSRE